MDYFAKKQWIRIAICAVLVVAAGSFKSLTFLPVVVIPVMNITLSLSLSRMMAL